MKHLRISEREDTLAARVIHFNAIQKDKDLPEPDIGDLGKQR
jgi:hypothetical protein